MSFTPRIGCLALGAALALVGCTGEPVTGVAPDEENLATLAGLFLALEDVYEDTQHSTDERLAAFSALIAPPDHPRLAAFQHVIQSADSLIVWDRAEDIRRHHYLFLEQERGWIVGTNLEIEPYILKICEDNVCNLGGGRADISFSYGDGGAFALPGLRWDWVVQWDRGRYYITGWVETIASARTPVLWADVLKGLAGP